MIENFSSHIEISQSAVENNIGFIQQFLAKKTTLSCVIKGNAYGHGVAQMLPILQRLGVNHFSVFSSFEAKQAYAFVQPQSTIMIMGHIATKDIAWVVKHEIEFFIFNEKILNNFLAEAEKQNRKINVHLEIETGMHRHGIEKKILPKVIDIITKKAHLIKLKGVCTHFAGAESSANFNRIKRQQKLFLEGVKKIKTAGLNPEKLHTSCSAAVIAFPKFNFDMVRIGILQYGLWPSKESQLTYELKHKSNLTLKSVLSWRSEIMEIKQVKPGEFVGYGNSFLAERNLTIASVPVGYGDGFGRALSNVGRVLVNGKRLSVIGMVNMNMFLIDITGIEVNIGDIVTLIGDDGSNQIHVTYFGDLSNQLNYELLTRLDKNLPRIVVD